MKKTKLKPNTHLNLPILNRSLLILRPKEPYIQWIKQLPPPDDQSLHKLAISSITDDSPAFLIPNDCDPNDAIEHYLPYLWHEMLAAWCTDQTAWPKKMNLKEFERWFKVEEASMIFDLPNREALDYEEG